jgi:surfactin synthase thioesterase subunit
VCSSDLYLGGDARSFEHWTHGAYSRIELYAVQPPGRDGAGAATSLNQLIDEITHEVEQLQGRPVALYGHSFGAWLAAAVAGNLIARGILQPAHLFVAAAPGPGTGHPLLTALDTFRQEHTPDDVPEAILFGQLRKLGMHSGGMHSDLAGAIRADLRLALHFDAGTVPKLALPVTAIWGRGDVSCPAEVVGTWANYCNGSFRNVAVDGGHLFLEESANSVIGVIESHLAASEVELAGHA